MGKNITFPHVINFRDVGGFETTDKRRVKEGLVYRSGGFYYADEGDVEVVMDLGIKYVVDFRETNEHKDSPDKFPSEITVYELPAIVENEYTENKTLNFFELLNSDTDVEGIYEANKFLREVYTFIAFDNEAFAKTFELIENKEVPLLFHCAGGKDRTGVMAALIQTLLGVDYETVLENYLYSNVYRNQNGYMDEQIRIRNITNPQAVEAIAVTIGVQRGYLDSTYKSIIDKYGTMEEYFLNEYGLDETRIARIKDYYLES